MFWEHHDLRPEECEKFKHPGELTPEVAVKPAPPAPDDQMDALKNDLVEYNISVDGSHGTLRDYQVERESLRKNVIIKAPRQDKPEHEEDQRAVDKDHALQSSHANNPEPDGLNGGGSEKVVLRRGNSQLVNLEQAVLHGYDE